MQVMEGASSFSLQSNDSLRDAFASLDAASAERSQHSITSILGSLNASTGFSQTELRACRRQDSNLVTAKRALCGGDTLEQMRKDVVDRAERRARIVRQQNTSEQDMRTLSVHSGAPSFTEFPMSIEEAQKSQSTSSMRDEAEERDESKSLQTPTPAEPTSTATPAATIAPASSANDPPAEKRNKRTFQWAAKRDKRIARRREGPPLTRSQAREQGTSDDVLPRSSGHQLVSSSAPLSEDISADVTDPSYGTIVTVEVPQKAKGRPATRRKKTPPLLDMTFTEITSRVVSEIDTTSSQKSSQTQDDINSQDATFGRIAAKKRQECYDSSDTEEEDDLNDEVVQAWKRRKTAGMEHSKAQGGRRPKAAASTSTARGKTPVVGSSTAKTKATSTKHKGPLLFEGLRFIAFGFWAKVKMFEKLIEKHGGTVVKAGDYSNKATINYLVSCTHSGYKPALPEIERWKLQMAKDYKSSSTEVTNLFSDTMMIQEQWISDCIAKCLRKTDLLAVDKYTISTK